MDYNIITSPFAPDGPPDRQSALLAIKSDLTAQVRPYLSVFYPNPAFEVLVACIDTRAGTMTTTEPWLPGDELFGAVKRRVKEEVKRLLESPEDIYDIASVLVHFHSEPGADSADHVLQFSPVYSLLYQKFLPEAIEPLAGGHVLCGSWPRHFKEALYCPILKLDFRWLANFIDFGKEGRPAFLEALALELEQLVSKFGTTVEKPCITIDYSKPETFYPQVAARFLSILGEPLKGGSLYRSICAISETRYERKDCGSQIAFTRDAGERPCKVRLEKPVPLTDSRKVRKLLEACGEARCLLSDGRHVFGICGRDDPDRDASAYCVEFKKHQTWEIRRRGNLLLRYDEGKLSTIYQRLDESTYIHHLQDRLGLSRKAAGRILSLIRAAQTAGHGTTLVFSDSAPAEAARLKESGIPVAPFRLEEKDLPALSSIDGALLIDCGGLCHALGVILDGEAVPGPSAPSADDSASSRGARYHSANRYYHGRLNRKILIVVVSDDGMIDFFPKPPETAVKP